MMKRNIQFLIISLIGMIVLTACGFGNTTPATKPTVQLNLASGTNELVVGQVISIQAIAVDQSGVARVDLQVDGQLLATVPVAPAEATFIASQTWIPDVPGSHAIQAQAINSDGQPSDLVTIVVTVNDVVTEAEEATAAVDEAEASQPAPVDAEQVDVIEASSGDTLEPVAEPTATIPVPYNGAPTVEALSNLNVRSGPGLEYPVLGQLLYSQAAVVTGRNPEGTWFEVIYPANSNTRGWVTGNTQYVNRYNTETVPVAAVPLPPTATPLPTATPTLTPVPPTATLSPTNTAEPPAPVKPTIHHFTADRYAITAGESVTLQWDLSNAQVAYLVYSGHSEGVVAPGSTSVAPAVTTQYTLVAINAAGETSVTIEIVVNPAEGGGDGPDIVLPGPLEPLPINPGIIVTVTPTPKPIQVIPGIIAPVPTLQMVPGYKIIPSP
jgi:uncharacterized protein YraI